MNVSFVSRRSSRVHLQTRTFILRNIVENHCDMAYLKYCKIFVYEESLFKFRDLAPLMSDLIRLTSNNQNFALSKKIYFQ